MDVIQSPITFRPLLSTTLLANGGMRPRLPETMSVGGAFMRSQVTDVAGLRGVSKVAVGTPTAPFMGTALQILAFFSMAVTSKRRSNAS